MNFQNFVIEHHELLLLVAGTLMLFLGLAPITSLNYYKKYHESKWDDKLWPFSKRDGYIYDRYIRQTKVLLVGLSLVVYAVYKLFNS